MLDVIWVWWDNLLDWVWDGWNISWIGYGWEGCNMGSIGIWFGWNMMG